MSREDNLNWYHKDLTREDTELVLKGHGGDGVFLVRDSKTSEGDYVLSVLHQDEVYHYQIRRHGDDAFFSIDDQTPIHGLDSLIEQYRETPDGLVTQLSAIVKNIPPPANARRHGTSNLLHRATKKGHLTIIEGKLFANSKKKVYQLDAKDENGRTVVHLACQLDVNAEQILKNFLDRGASVNCRDEEGYTPLHYACRTKPLAFIELLINAKASIDARNIDTGRVPLHEAAIAGNLDVVKKLLKLGVPHLPRTKNYTGPDGITHEECTPLQLAEIHEHKDTADYLRNYTPPAPNTDASKWCHGTLTRGESAKILQKHVKVLSLENTLGTFLVRISERENTHVLTLLGEDHETRNYVIKRTGDYFYIDEGPYMLSLNHMIDHYMRFSDGLPTTLRYPVPPLPKPELPPSVHTSQEVTPPKPKSTFPRFFKSTKSKSPITPAKSEELSRERKLSKDSDQFPATWADTKYRSFSIPSNDSMNRVCLPSPTQSNLSLPQESSSTKFKKSPRKGSSELLNFHSLKYTKGRNIIIDGMKSLKISKKDKKLKENHESNDNASNLVTNDNISKSLKNLSFSSDFKVEDVNDEVYKIPNSIPVADIQNHNVLTSKSRNNSENATGNDDLEQFIRSDKVINSMGNESLDKDNAIEEIYFIEAPTKAAPIPTESINYIKFKQHPYFPEPKTYANDISDPSSSNAANNNCIENDMITSSSPSRSKIVLSNDTTFGNDLNLLVQNNINGNSSEFDLPHYYIPPGSIRFDDVLGYGEFGSVHKGYMKCETQNGETTEIPVAVKTLHNEHCKENRNEFLREARVMIKLSHHCIVRMFGISKSNSITNSGLMIVQELVSLGSLLDYLKTNADKINPKFELKIWASQIACGMNYLETKRFVHRDLAARNILLSSIHQAKISDFGLSRALCNSDYYTSAGGAKWPVKWYAPESLNYGTFSHASDVWSFGVTLWEMFSFGLPPYGDMPGAEAQKLLDSGVRLLQPENCPDNVFDIMSSCWNYKPRDRPTFRFLTEFFSQDPDYYNIIELIKTQNIH